MSIEKQELLKSIETLPEELIVQLLDYMEYLKFTSVINNAPKDLIIKDEKDLREKFEDGNVCTLDEAFEEIEKSL